MDTIDKAMVYVRFTKPKVWGLLVFVGVVSALIAIPAFNLRYLWLLTAVVLALAAGSSGAESLTNYLDRDIDSRMLRTNRRPMVTGEVTPASAIITGVVLIAISIAIPLVVGRFIAAGFMAAGVIDNVFIYSYLLKRKTPWSVILGGFSGGIPVLVGWYMISNVASFIPWFLFSLVIVWIPIHIWSLAYMYHDDYARAGVPMLPVVYSDRVSAECISFSALLLVLFSFIPVLFGGAKILYIILIGLAAVPVLIYIVRFSRKPDRKSSFSLFKYSSPYLTVVFIIFALLRFL
ncbi:MAG: heme o synthase [Candidatus Thermoplasmatota archaeon]|nr:heme o synthase [Candidatus Thermoplasmatota archaeon]